MRKLCLVLAMLMLSVASLKAADVTIEITLNEEQQRVFVLMKMTPEESIMDYVNDIVGNARESYKQEIYKDKTVLELEAIYNDSKTEIK